ncbi:MAG: hypothetical protein ABS79_06450 [Planctomycetes bacterium SCN 63-9]|nr:MAG: hypothetical protein ABS79_06450 [Planctomycetes bacterium SCN 63-9]
MSFLAPLYILGGLAIAAPIIFHLIRRTPSGEVPFSSLMFLDPSPPRLSKRSRLDQILLLLLRAAALALLAFAFARPFLRAKAQVEANGETSTRERIALLVDTSASMRRGDLWTRAKALASQLIDEVRPGDAFAVFTFDNGSRTVLGFEESATLDPRQRLEIARTRLNALQPSWASTQLGQALVDVVTAINDVVDAGERGGNVPRRVILIGDLQQGSRTDALGEFEWPSDVVLDLKPVADDGSNAGIHGLADAPGVAADPEAETSLRVRVSNDYGTRDSFTLTWAGEEGIPLKGETPTPAYVPPGESRVIRVPRPKGTQARADAFSKRSPRLVLGGDQRDFDNTLYLAEKSREEATVLYLGSDADDKIDDPNGLLYYVRRAFVDTPRRRVKVVAQAPASAVNWPPNTPPALVIVAGEVGSPNAARLRDYVQQGGTLLNVLNAPGKVETSATVAGVPPWTTTEARVGRDVILGEIAFDHPLFAPFAAPQFNDFTKIHFWKYRKLDPAKLGEGARVLAKFEKGDPAIIEKSAGKGRLLVMASGWSPADSQLARSSKFAPLLTSLSEGNGGTPLVEGNLVIGDRVPLPASGVDPSKPRVIRKPDGTRVTLASAETTFAGTDQPGLYVLETSAGDRPFAVNLDPLESRVAPLHVETLEQLGCRLAKPTREQAPDPEQLRQLQNSELEGRQKYWRWLVLAAIAFLIAETWLSGRLSSTRSTTRTAHAEAMAS